MSRCVDKSEPDSSTLDEGNSPLVLFGPETTGGGQFFPDTWPPFPPPKPPPPSLLSSNASQPCMARHVAQRIIGTPVPDD